MQAVMPVPLEDCPRDDNIREWFDGAGVARRQLERKLCRNLAWHKRPKIRKIACSR